MDAAACNVGHTKLSVVAAFRHCWYRLISTKIPVLHSSPRLRRRLAEVTFYRRFRLLAE